MEEQFTPIAEGDVKNALKRRPLLVLFYMDGCSHCISTLPHWKEMAKKYPKCEAIQIESSMVEMSGEKGVNGYPTMKFKPKKGRERVLSGEQGSASEIARKLGLLSRFTRRNTRRLRGASRRSLRH